MQWISAILKLKKGANTLAYYFILSFIPLFWRTKVDIATKMANCKLKGKLGY